VSSGGLYVTKSRESLACRHNVNLFLKIASTLANRFQADFSWSFRDDISLLNVSTGHLTYTPHTSRNNAIVQHNSRLRH